MKYKSIAAVLLCALPLANANAGLREGKEAYARGDFPAALAEVRPLAEQGNAEAQLMLGTMYQFGKGIQKDDVEANRWNRKAADQGNVKAQFVLGLNYSLGRGVAENQAEAAAWYRKAAEQGYVFAQFEMGTRYELGRGVNKDLTEAIRWYRMAANQGDCVARWTLEALGQPIDSSAASVKCRSAR